MQNRKVYQLLLLMDEKEQKAFADYLNAPLFQASKTIAQFYQLWREKLLAPGADQQGEISPAAFLKGSKLLVSRIDKYCSQLYKKALDFLALQEYLASAQTQLTKGAEALERRNAPRREWELQQQRLNSLVAAMPEGADKALQQLQVKWRDAEMRTHNRETPDIWKEDFRDLHSALDQYYCLQKLKLACASANAHLIYNHTEHPEQAEDIAFWESTAPDQLGPLTRAYWYAFQFFVVPDSPFQPYFDHLQRFSHLFSKAEALEVFIYALNYCVRRATRGEIRFKQYTAAIHRELLDKKILLVDEKLPAAVMKNIVVVHCAVGELDWVENFLAEYKDRLPPGTDPHLFLYNEAILAFFRADYPQAIHKFRQVISHLKNDVFYELDARANLLLAYFDHREQLSLGEVDDMYRLFDSCRIFIDRNEKISQTHKLRYGNLLRFLKRFLQILEKPSLRRGKIEVLYQEVMETELMVSKNWLLERIASSRKPVGEAEN